MLKNEDLENSVLNYYKLEQIRIHLEKYALDNKANNSNNVALTINYEII